jgi:hypothetical protein
MNPDIIPENRMLALTKPLKMKKTPLMQPIKLCALLLLFGLVFVSCQEDEEPLAPRCEILTREVDFASRGVESTRITVGELTYFRTGRPTFRDCTAEIDDLVFNMDRLILYTVFDDNSGRTILEMQF